jgi:protein-S-isoprenylcysteine O-methyltransferase Ste14
VTAFVIKIKGFDRLRKHVPELNTPLGILRLFGVPVLLYFFVTDFFTLQDLASFFWILAGEIVVGTLGFAWLYMFFRVRIDFSAKYGSLAYSKAISRFGYPAGGTLFAVVARIGNIPGPPFPRLWWYPVLPLFGGLLVVAGALLFLRAIQTFGVDNLTMLYVYFPQESQLVDHNIYNILRHPAYGAAQRIALGLALLNGNWLALTCAVTFMLGLWGWVHVVEEKELLERFGPSYAEYRRRVPAFWPRLRDLGHFFKFLLTGS